VGSDGCSLEVELLPLATLDADALRAPPLEVFIPLGDLQFLTVLRVLVVHVLVVIRTLSVLHEEVRGQVYYKCDLLAVGRGLVVVQRGDLLFQLRVWLELEGLGALE